MQSTRSASTMLLRIPPPPDWFDDIEPLASTKPATPAGARWWTMCCIQAKLALPAGGAPYCQRLSLRKRSPAPVAHIEGRVGKDEVGPQVGMAVVVEGVAVRDLAVDATDGEVHARQPPGGIVRLLAVDRDV